MAMYIRLRHYLVPTFHQTRFAASTTATHRFASDADSKTPKTESRWQRLKRERRLAPTPANRTKHRLPSQPQSLTDALSHVRSAQWAKFDESLELSLRLNVDPRHADQNLRGTILLPHGTGREARVAVFADGTDAIAARSAGADLVGAQDLIDSIAKSKGASVRRFAACISVPELLPIAASRLGKILGPKGLMPTVKQGTVTSEVADAVRRVKKGQISYRTDRDGNMHLLVGKLSFNDEQLVENVLEATNVMLSIRPAAVKKKYMKKISVCSSMGPSVDLNVEALTRAAMEYGNKTL